jgi:hypothetical protein
VETPGPNVEMKSSYIKTPFFALIPKTLLAVLDVAGTTVKEHFSDTNSNIKTTVKSMSYSHCILKAGTGGTR